MAFTQFWSFLVVILILITIHEWGHYFVARRCGVAIEKFSIGFGPTVLTWTNKLGTEFCLAAIPLGGYVKMKGEYTIATSEQQSKQGQDSFAACTVWQRMAIVAAGPLVNLIFAALIYSVLSYGRHEVPAPIVETPVASSLAASLALKKGDTIESVNGVSVKGWDEVSAQLLQSVFDKEDVHLAWYGSDGNSQRGSFATDSLDIESSTWMEAIGLKVLETQPRLGQVFSGAARDAGLQRGDEIVRVNADEVKVSQELLSLITQSSGQTLMFEVKRLGQLIITPVVPRPVLQTAIKDGVKQESTVGKIGAQILTVATTVYHQGAWASLQYGVKKTFTLGWMNVRAMFKIITGQLSINNIGGPIKTAQITGESVQYGIKGFLLVLAFLSVSLGAINLLPIPVLDGGHLVYYAFEALTGRAVSDKALAIGQRVGLVLLLFFMGVAFYNDGRELFG